MSAFVPSRTAALARLDAFLPSLHRYAENRNDTTQSATSRLSPYLTTRLLTEEEVLRAVLARTSYRNAEKFIQEVAWRTYWKGWLEMRPTVWRDYLSDLSLLRAEPPSQAHRAAREGRTGITSFDSWARELTSTGWLHNHARMWFASIWIFTLRLPWPLGAAFFLEHLLDGDAASNTLSWRWVAGLHTVGKHYLARSTNIAQYSGFPSNPGLCENADPLTDPRTHPCEPLSLPMELPPAGRIGRLLHPGDVSLPSAHAALHFPLEHTSHAVQAFRAAAVADRGVPILPFSGAVMDAWARKHGFEMLQMPWLTIGPLRDAFAADPPATPVHFTVCEWDRQLWPHATHGYFRFKRELPALCAQLAP